MSNAALPRVRAAGFWKVDADLYRQSGWGRMTAREAFGMRDQRLIEHLLAGGVEPRRLVGVHGRWRHVADSGVAMGVVVPGKESLTERTGVFDGVKARRKGGLVLQGLELRFRVRIVVADMGPAVTSGDTEIGEQKRHGLGAHRGAAVGMQGELPRTMLSLSQVAAMSSWASSADSRGAIIQPIT